MPAWFFCLRLFFDRTLRRQLKRMPYSWTLHPSWNLASALPSQVMDSASDGDEPESLASVSEGGPRLQGCAFATYRVMCTYTSVEVSRPLPGCRTESVTCDFQTLLTQCSNFGSICVKRLLRGLTGLTMRTAQLVHNLMKLRAPMYLQLY